MDLLEDFDFDFDPEEVMRRADGMSIIGSASASAVGPDNIGSPAEKRLNEVLHYPEGELAHHLSREERYVDSFEGMDDAALEEAMQHIPESFGYQMPPTERLLSPAPCVHSTSPYGITQNAQRTEHRALYCEYDTDLSNDVGDLLPSEALRYAKRCSDFEATNNEHYMEWMDDAAFEEAINREKDLRSPQLPEYLSMSSQHDTVSQRDARGAGRYASHQDSTPETMKEHRTQLTDDVSHACEPAKKPDEDLLQVEALSEALQYAYANNLTTDYLLTSSSITHLFGPLAQSTIPMTNNDGFTDHSHLSDAKLPNPVVSDQSKALTMTPFASGLIDEARQFQSEEAIQSLAEEVCNFDKFKTMRLELPILRTDNEWDLSVFQDLYLGRSESLLRSIKKHRLPLHPQNLEDGEGMELSSKDRAKIEGIMKRTEEEKVSVTKESLTYLVSQLQHDYPLEDRVQYMAGAEDGEGHPPVSPKLIPKQSVPAIDPTQLPIPPDDASSLLSDNFHAIEAIMLQDYQDVWSADTSPVREFLEDELAISGQDPFLEQPRKTLEDFKIDVPLMVDRMPQRSEGLEPFKNFVDAEMDLDPEFKRALPHDIPDDPFDRELREKLEQSAQLVLRSIEQERLQAIDAMGRVPVPVMDFLIPEPAWKRLRGNNRSETNILKWIQAGKEQLFKPPSWPVDRAAASKMIWNPLAAGADKVNENESIPAGEPLLKRYLDLPLSHEVQTSRDYIHQKEKAIVLEDDDHDEDIEMQLGSEKAMVGLVDSVRKRFMNTNTGAARKRLRRHLTEQRSPNQTKDHVGPSLLPGDSPGASGDLLANFMEVHAPQKGALRHSKYFNSGPSDAPSLSAPVLAHTKQDHTQTHQLSKASIKAPCPTMGTPTTDMTIFISITIPRRMVRALEGLAPRLTLLERNYDSHNTFYWKPGSVVRTEIVPSLADDADITVSPSTGLIVTSMIRVRQKPRAGTTRSMLQIRVEKASLRYEKLIILIGGDGGKDDVLGFMSSSESYALLELQGFASGLDCNVQVHFVGGGDQTLTNWVAAFIFRYSLADPKIIAGLIEPETLWEVFLRRAGFNVFAAQVVASHFRPPSDKTNADSSFQYGLGAFMTMTRDERMRHFGQLVGAGIMERVSRNVDEVWNSG